MEQLIWEVGGETGFQHTFTGLPAFFAGKGLCSTLLPAVSLDWGFKILSTRSRGTCRTTRANMVPLCWPEVAEVTGRVATLLPRLPCAYLLHPCRNYGKLFSSQIIWFVDDTNANPLNSKFGARHREYEPFSFGILSGSFKWTPVKCKPLKGKSSDPCAKKQRFLVVLSEFGHGFRQTTLVHLGMGSLDFNHKPS